jgi:hypothetical protein
LFEFNTWGLSAIDDVANIERIESTHGGWNEMVVKACSSGVCAGDRPFFVSSEVSENLGENLDLS